MIKFSLLIILLVALALPASGQAVPAVDCALIVYQYDTAGEQVMLFADTTTFLQGMKSSGFITGFSIEVEMTEIDTAGCAFRIHAVTLGPPVNNYSQQFRVEYTLPARLDHIYGKDSVQYSLVIQPLGQLDIDTAGCGIDHRKQDAFKFTPSGYMDIYFAENTFGDFYWSRIKDMFEYQYRQFKSINNYNLPGKYLIYLCPCPMYSVIWDGRFGMMVDPTRNTSYAIHSKEMNSADPFLVLQASVFKNYGYAPPFLSEGFAGYLSLAEFQMKKIVSQNENLPLDSLLDTYTYLSLDPIVADKTSASLTKYLIGQYGASKFLTLYKKADDLNIRQVMVDIYDKSIIEIETEWLNYIDTFTFTREDLLTYASQAESMFDYVLMKEYNLELLKSVRTSKDTLDVLPAVVQAAFNTGEYYDAIKFQTIRVKLQPGNSSNYVGLAGYKMMEGLYPEALELLEKARSLDSVSQYIDFNLGLQAFNSGETERGWQIMAGIILNTAGGGPQGEARALYGNYLAQSKSEKDKTLATQYCSEAINTFGQSIRAGNASPEAYLWSGIAYLGLGDTGNAWDHLWLARFMEVRPFYVGLANLWLGKVADVMGDHEAAQELYSLVISGPAAEYHQAEARRLANEPYRQ